MHSNQNPNKQSIINNLIRYLMQNQSIFKKNG
jgi:hypothetical protein